MTDEGDGSQGPDTGTRRLCAALSSDRPGLLAEACQGARFGRLFLAVLTDGTQVAIAPSGIEEVRLVHDLVDAVTVLVPDAPEPGAPPMGPTLLALNVGIMRVLDDGFTGTGWNARAAWRTTRRSAPRSAITSAPTARSAAA